MGTLALGIANAIGSSAVTVAAGAVFDLEGFSDTVGSLAGAGSLTSSAAGTAIAHRGRQQQLDHLLGRGLGRFRAGGPDQGRHGHPDALGHEHQYAAS